MFDRIPLSARIHYQNAELDHNFLKTQYSQLRKRLSELKLKEGEILFISADNSPAFLLALLAGVDEKLCLVPIDPQMKREEVEKLHGRMRPRAFLLTGTSTAWQDFETSLKIQLDANGVWKSSQSQRTSFEPRLLVGTACIQLTSGSTGNPKGLMISRESLFWRAENIRRALQLNAQDRTLCTVPLSHSHGTDCLAFPTLLAGGALYLKNPGTAYPYRILEWIESEKITFFSSVPGMYEQFNRMPAQKNYELSSLRHPFCGSAALAKETALAFEKKYGLRIKQGYGLAEIAVICLNLHAEEPITFESIGKPIEGVQFRIAEDGELFVRSKALFQGYLDMPDETASRLIQGELSTRDLVSQDANGQLFLTGRKDDFINVSGQKVYPLEIENALSSLSELEELCVVSEPDPDRMEIPVLHAVASSRTTGIPRQELEQKIRSHLNSRLEAFKIPQKIYWHSQLPKSPLGKVLRSKLKGS